MKRTLVERVAMKLWWDATGKPWKIAMGWARKSWKREARHIIAMVRRHDARKGAKK